MDTRWKSCTTAIVMVLLAVATTACQPQHNTSPTGQANSAPTAPYPATSAYPDFGGVGSTLTLPDGSVSITLVSVEQHGSMILFHFRAQNNTGRSFSLIGPGADYRFIIPRAGTATTIQTTGVPQSDLAAHPPLPSGIAPNAKVDGWVAVDTAAIGGTPSQILYRYATVQTQKCANPADPITCQPAELFRSLIWNFQL